MDTLGRDDEIGLCVVCELDELVVGVERSAAMTAYDAGPRLLAYFLSNISAKYYENPTMLSRVIAKNIGNVF